jgi:Flp pilus assembly protein CpaB
MTYRLRNIGIAVALALIAVLLVLLYVTDYKRTVQSGEEQVSVYVAAENVPSGTSGADALSRHLIEKREVARRNLAPGWIASEDQVKTLVASQNVYAGEQATTQLFRPASEKGIRSQLSGNLRALQLPGTSPQLLEGTLKAGDHVDVVGTWNLPEDKTSHVSRTVLRDLLVLRAPTPTPGGSKLTSPTEQASVMLALTDAQAEKLWWVAKNGDWSLQLRPTQDAADSPESIQSAGTLALDGLKGGQLKKLLHGKGN